VQADSYGRYYFNNNQTGYYYFVRAWTNVSGQWYKGDSGTFYLRTDISTPAIRDITIQMPSLF
jgi:hypothetical protein